MCYMAVILFRFVYLEVIVVWLHHVFADCRICVWNASDGSLVHSLTGHTDSVSA